MTATLTTTSLATSSTKPSEIHVVCSCNDDRAQCGADVSNLPWTDNEPTCAVCADLEFAPCPYCGECAE